jgi:hypothetical protein
MLQLTMVILLGMTRMVGVKTVPQKNIGARMTLKMGAESISGPRTSCFKMLRTPSENLLHVSLALPFLSGRRSGADTSELSFES